MPTYEYRCKTCGEHLEVVQSFTDDPLSECPACGGDLRKVFGSIGISFKGSGFYKTDSRSSSRSTAPATASSGSDSSSGDSSSTASPGTASSSGGNGNGSSSSSGSTGASSSRSEAKTA